MGAEARLAGRRLHFDGQDWSVLYTDVRSRMTLLSAGLGLVLRALRTGLMILQTDPLEIVALPQPVDREQAAREWRVLDATIAGAWAHGTLPEYALDLLEHRLNVLTAYLGAPREPGPGSAVTGYRLLLSEAVRS